MSVEKLSYQDLIPMKFKHQDIIDEFWWKTASLMTQVDAWNWDFILPYTAVKTTDFEARNSKKLELEWSQIVRWSASGDEKSLVDALRTKKHVAPKSLNQGLHKRLDLSQPAKMQNRLEALMFDRWIGLDKIAEKLWIDTRGFEEKYDYKKALEDHFRDSEFGYPQPFFFWREEWQLEVKFSDDEIRELEYGNRDDNPIQNIISHSRSDSVIKTAIEWDGLDNYNWVQSTLIQPMNYNNTRWSIVEHPHIEWHYLLNLVSKNPSSEYEYIYQLLLDHKWNVVAQDFDGSASSKIPVSYEDIVKMKQRSRKVWFTPEQYSSQVELLFLNDNSISWEGHAFSKIPTSPVIQAQERAFLPFDFGNAIKPEKYHFNNFWVPKDWLKLRTINLNDGYENIDSSLFNDGIDSVYVLNEHNVNRESGSLGFIPNNMKAIIVPNWITVWGNSLEHNTYRYIVKAWVAIMLDSRYSIEEYWGNLHTWEQIKLSNNERVVWWRKGSGLSRKELFKQLRWED